MKFPSFLLAFFVCIGISFAQKNKILKPDEFLPHAYAKEFTPHHLLVDYFEHVADRSDHIILEEYGRTNEHRPLLLAYISSKKNIANLEKIRKTNLHHAGLPGGSQDWNENVSIVWLGYSVHGNEAAGSEASMAVLYKLANKDADEVQRWLENTVVIMDPSVNPDGYSRYTHWNNQVSNSINNVQTNSLEHNEPWPGGRMNHYYFDLNRDWAWQSQVESQQRMKKYNMWMPHVVADVHEMGINSPYYFAPAARPYHEYINEWQGDFQHSIGKNHAKYFDQKGWLYFTREVFDLLYPSYGDTYPTFNGGIGMTYEQGGSGQAGRAVEISNGDTLRLTDRIAHHKATSLSTIEMGHLHADQIISNFKSYFADSKSNPKGKYKSFVIKGSNPKGKVDALCALLDRLGIEYGQATSSKSKSGFSYKKGKNENFSLQENDIVISAHQARSVMIQVLFEPQTSVEDSITYDITAWSLPFAYGLDAYALTDKMDAKAIQKQSTEAATLQESYAFALPWESVETVKKMSELQKAGIRSRVASGKFTIDGKSFSAGTVLVTRADNKNIKSLSTAIQNSIGSESVIPLSTGFSDAGFDIGSSKNSLVGKTKVLTVRGENVSPYSFGQIWHYFEQVIHFPLTVVELSDFLSQDFDDYTHIIFPEGWYSFSDEELEGLNKWISGGGNLITIGSSMNGLIGKTGFSISRKDPSAEPAPESKLDEVHVHYSDIERKGISNQVYGAICKIKLDPTHPLAFGLGDVYHSLKTSSTAYAKLGSGWNVASLDQNFTYYGFAGAKAKKRLEDTLMLGVQSKGRGSITYFVDNPLYRGFWEEGKLLFANALFQVNK